MIESKHIRADGTTEIVKQFEWCAFTLQELQDYVGGYIELVSLKDGKVMVVNEEGRLLGLPHNSEATKLAGMSIVGDVFVTDQSLID